METKNKEGGSCKRGTGGEWVGDLLTGSTLSLHRPDPGKGSEEQVQSILTPPVFPNNRKERKLS